MSVINHISNFVVCDAESGTYFGANNAMILDTRKLTPEQQHTLNEGSDSERSDLMTEVGEYIEPLIDLDTL